MKRSASFIQIQGMAAVVAAALVYLFVAPLILASRAEARIYWTNSTAGTLGRAGLDGSDVDQGFISGVLHPYGLAVDGAHVYWTWNAGGFCNFGQCSAFVGRADLDGSGVHQDFVGSGYSNVSGAAVDDAYLYFGRRDTQCEDDYETEEDVCFTTIAIVGLDGPGLPSIDLGEVFPNGVAVDGAHVYWGTGGTIGRANLDGSNVNQGFITTASSWGVAVDPAHVYWTNSGTGTIGRANLDGTGVDQNFITGAANPKGVAVDESHIYWANNGSNTIGRANLDGSGADQSFITGATGPVGVAVDMPPEVPPETQIDSGPTGLTNDSTPTFSFSSSEPGSTFECRLNSGGGGLMEDAFNFASVGSFAPCTSPETLAALPDGGYVFEVRAVDVATNTDPTPASRSFTVDTAPVDTTAPETQIDSGPSGLTNDSTPTFSFSSTEPGSTFECRLNSGGGGLMEDAFNFASVGSFAPCTSPETLAALPDGGYVFEVRAVDVATNTDPTPASRSFTVDTAPVDTTAPETQIDSGPSGLTNDSTPTFSFSSTEPGSTFECKVDYNGGGGGGGGAEDAFSSASVGSFAPCTSPETLAALPDGGYVFEVRATDVAAHTDPTPASRGFTVDTAAPETQIDSGPSGSTNDATPTFAFSSDEEGSTFECRLDGGAFENCSSPLTTSTLSDGLHIFEVRATDVAAHTDPTPASRGFTVDTAAPETQIDSGPSGPTNDATPTFAFSSDEEGSTFECRLDGGAFENCSSPLTTSTLSDGLHIFEVRATDVAAHTDPTPASRGFTVDTAAPETQIDSGPSGPTNDSTPTFAFSSTDPGSTFECRLNSDGGGGFEGPDGGGGIEGPDGGGGIEGPDGGGGIEGPDGGGGFEDAFNSASVGSFAPCTSPETLAALADGGYVFEVRAVDAATNTDPTPASGSFTVDTTPIDTTAPETQIDSGPTGPTDDSTPTFTFSSLEEGATFECRLDGDRFADCDSPLTADPLPDGPHSFEVRARDAAANTDPSPASRSFTIDTAAPDTSIDSGPAGSTNDNTPTFAFSSEQGESFECRLDGGGYAACSSPLTTSPLSDGPHSFDVRATDAVANTDPSPASRNFAVDTTPPDTTIDSGPAAGSTTGDNTPTFTFSSEQGVSFECRIDGSAFSFCSPPHYEDLDDEEPAVGTPSEGGSFTPPSPLTDGPHTFEVRARDAAANTDPSPASRSFTVDATPPDTSVDSGPSGPTNDTTPSFDFSSGDQNASFACRVDDGAYSACSTPFTTDPLPEGPHTFEVRASDAVGNTDPNPASRSFTVDTTPPETSIDSGPTGPTNDPTPSFTFSSEQGASFECRIDGGVYSACSSPLTTSPLTNGPHSFEVRATDAVANTDPSPASASFRIARGSAAGPRSTGPISADTLPPDMKLSGGGKQTVGEPIEVEVSCPEDCAVVASGKVLVWGTEDRHAAARSTGEKARIGLRKARRQLIAGETATLKLMPKRARAGLELMRLVRSGHKARAAIRVKFTDRAGNSRTASLSIGLQKREG